MMKEWTKAPHFTRFQRFLFALEPLFAGLAGWCPEVLWLE